MRKALFFTLIILPFCLGAARAQDTKIVFLHHSTGGLIYNDGKVAKLIQEYNQKNGVNYSISEKNFPDKPYVWANYPFDYWNIWINGYCGKQKQSPNYPSVACLEDICSANNVIILKHCYPGADILEDTGTPAVNASRKSLENYKMQYRALREKFREFPNNDFIIWTLAPRHRLDANSPANAGRAKEFVDWVKNEWLTEEGKTYQNIHIFDYFSLSAEMQPTSAPPRIPYTLKYEYERAHDQDDSHPNKLASEEIGPQFFQFIINTINKRNGRLAKSS